MNKYANNTEANRSDLVLCRYGDSVCAGRVQQINEIDGLAIIRAEADLIPVPLVKLWPAKDVLEITEQQADIVAKLESLPPINKIEMPRVSSKNLSLSEVIYTEYCRAVGGKAYNGDTLPDWATFSKDPAKAKQCAAWVSAAMEASAWFVEKSEPIGLSHIDNAKRIMVEKIEAHQHRDRTDDSKELYGVVEGLTDMSLSEGLKLTRTGVLSNEEFDKLLKSGQFKDALNNPIGISCQETMHEMRVRDVTAVKERNPPGA